MSRFTTDNREFERSLEELRNEIDLINYEMLWLLARRIAVAEEMGRYKYTHNITILQLQRWKELFADRIKKGSKAGLDTKFLASLLQLVHEQSIQIQTNVMNEDGRKG